MFIYPIGSGLLALIDFIYSNYYGNGMSNTTKQVNLALTIEEAKMLRKALGYYQMEAYVQKDDTTAESCMDLFQKIYACEKEAGY